MANRDSISSVYFVEAVGLGLIKIGYAINLPQRFTSLMTSSPVPLTLLGVMDGGAALETRLHIELAEHRTHGEWFLKCPAVLAVVAQARPSEGQEWLNQKARIRGAGLQEYLARMKAGEVVRPTRGPTRNPKKRRSRYDWSSDEMPR
jgi:hypothetical protein